MVERVLGKDEVTGSIPVPGSRIWMRQGEKRIWEQLGGGNSTVESHSSKVMVAARLRQAGFKSRPRLEESEYVVRVRVAK